MAHVVISYRTGDTLFNGPDKKTPTVLFRVQEGACFRKLGAPYLGVLIIRILLCWVLH